MTDALARHEAEKYRAAWGHAEYRRVAPGERETERAWRLMGCRARDTLNDYGSGTGRPAAWFAGRGMDVLGIDHADNANETAVPVEIACLWDMPQVRASDYGFCTDVMEHIPPEKVADVLAGIASKTRIACYFRIATYGDASGPAFGLGQLHLTVLPADWWVAKIAKYFRSVQVVESSMNAVVIGRQKGEERKMDWADEAIDGIVYIEHPVSAADKAAIRGAGLRIRDSQFRPAGALPPAPVPSGDIPTRDEIATMKRAQVVEWLQAHGVDGPKGKLPDLRAALERIIYL